MNKLHVLTAFLTACLLLGGCLMSSCAAHPTPENVFEELYYDNAYTRNRVDQTEGLSYDRSWDTMGSPWRGDVSTLFFTSEQLTGDVWIYCTRETPTVLFVYEVEEGEKTLYYAYRYAFETKELTYSTNDYEATEPHPFLFDVVLKAWVASNDPDGDQTYKTEFSEDSWGTYTLVTPYDLP